MAMPLRDCVGDGSLGAARTPAIFALGSCIPSGRFEDCWERRAEAASPRKHDESDAHPTGLRCYRDGSVSSRSALGSNKLLPFITTPPCNNLAAAANSLSFSIAANAVSLATCPVTRASR